MSRIAGKDTKPEELVRKYLFSKGFRYRKNVRKLPGTPDVVLPKYRTVIFVNGCFWHGHEGCKYYVLPKTNVEFWKNKIERNIARDKKVISAYLDNCYRVAVVWECSITGKQKEQKLSKVTEEISLWLEEDLTENYREF